MNTLGKYNLLTTRHYHRLVKKHNLKGIGYEGMWEIDKSGLTTLQIYLDGSVYPKSKKDIREISKVYYSTCMYHYLENDKDLIPKEGFLMEVYKSSGDILIRGVVGNLPNPISNNETQKYEVQ